MTKNILYMVKTYIYTMNLIHLNLILINNKIKINLIYKMYNQWLAGSIDVTDALRNVFIDLPKNLVQRNYPLFFLTIVKYKLVQYTFLVIFLKICMDTIRMCYTILGIHQFYPDVAPFTITIYSNRCNTGFLF